MTAPKPLPERARHLRPPNYFECRRVLAVLNRMQNLIRLREPWQAGLAQPDPSIPNQQGPEREIALEREINRLTPLVMRYLDNADISTDMVSRELDQRLDGREVVQRHVDRNWNLFEDYFEFDGRSDSYQFQM